MKKRLGSMLMAAAMVLSLASCQGGSTPTNAGGSQSNGGNNETPQEYLYVMGTGDSGGTTYAVGAGLSKLMNREIPGMKCTVETTSGSVDCVRMIGEGSVDVSVVSGDVAYMAANGTDSFEGAQVTNLYGLFACYSSMDQWLTLANSGIDSVYDIKGKTVGVGPAASSTEVLSALLIPAAGLDYPGDLDPRYINVSECASQLGDSQIAVGHMFGGVPFGAFLDVTETKDCRVISLEPELIQAVVDMYPYYFEATIPADTFKGQTEDVKTVGVKNMAVCSAEVPDEVAYQICKTAYENLEEFQTSHSALQEMVGAYITDISIEMHPGAVKYWTEVGLLK